MLFSVGEGGGVVDCVVVVEGVVVVGDGAWLPPLPQAAVIAPNAMRAAPPATVSAARHILFELIVIPEGVGFCQDSSWCCFRPSRPLCGQRRVRAVGQDGAP